MKHDEINNPAHYQLFPDMEAIDVIRAALTPVEFAGYLKGNALKYRLRAGDKGPAEKCIAKANWYQNTLRNDSPKPEAFGDFGQQNTLTPADWPDENGPKQQLVGQGGELGKPIYDALYGAIHEEEKQ